METPSLPSESTTEHSEPDELIAEGIVTTVNSDGSPNISPMGPRVDRIFTRLVLRPFQTSTTYQNLKRTGEGVFHITDDVLLIARAAVGRLSPLPPLLPAAQVKGFLLADACRWFAFRVSEMDDSHERTTIRCAIIGSGTLRPFFGFNRAKHAVLEAAILATRVNILPREQIIAELQRLAIPMEKTAGEQERQAFEFLRQYVTGQFPPADPAA
jgi:uncharacterized protein